MRNRTVLSDDDLAAFDARCERRESLIRRMVAVMGWEYHTSPVLTGMRKAALSEAVVVGLDKLEAILERLEGMP
jgi:hypothetical protein